MSRALVVTTDGNPLKFNFWCRNYDRFNVKDEVDRVYVTLGSNLSWELKQLFMDLCKERNFKLICNEPTDGGMVRLGAQLSYAVDEIQEDYYGLIEDDIWMTKSGTLNERFEQLENNECHLIGTLRESNDKREFPDINNIVEEAKKYDRCWKAIYPFSMWSSWVYGKTEVLKSLQHEFVESASKHNFMLHGGLMHPDFENVNKYFKSYHKWVPAWRLFTGNWRAKTKLPLIHPDWEFTDDSGQDEVFTLISFLLIKKLGEHNIKFEEQNKIMTDQFRYFDIENKTPQQWDFHEWVHCVGSSGWDGMYGFVRNEDSHPIYYMNSWMSEHNEGPRPPRSKEGGFRYACNYAFVETFSKPMMYEFTSDYKKYLDHHLIQDEADKELIDYMKTTMIQNLV